MKYMNIVISGDIATGKTTLGKMLAEKLNWRFESAGSFFRQYMREHNINLADKLLVPEEVEKNFDTRFLHMLKTTPNIVVEGHYQGWNARDVTTTFKILVESDLDTQLTRALKRHDDFNGTVEDILKRRDNLKAAFRKLYGEADYLSEKYFDLVIQNRDTSIETLCQNIYDEFMKRSGIA